MNYITKANALIETGQKIIEWEICSPSSSCADTVNKPWKKILQWTRDISDLALLIYGCAETDCFNMGQVSIKEIAAFMSEVFDVEIKDISNFFREIRKRKIKERTAFFDEMKEKVIRRMDNADNGIYTYRKGRKK